MPNSTVIQTIYEIFSLPTDSKAADLKFSFNPETESVKRTLFTHDGRVTLSSIQLTQSKFAEIEDWFAKQAGLDRSHADGFSGQLVGKGETKLRYCAFPVAGSKNLNFAVRFC